MNPSIPCWNRELYLQAARFACEAHSEQRFKDSVANYSLHLASVCMEVLASWHVMPDFDIDLAIQVSWLHDVLEDTPTTDDDIRVQFGDPVLACVRALTKNSELPRERRIPDVLERLAAVPREASIVKLADRVTNLQKPPRSWTAEKRAGYLEEAKVILASAGGAHSVLSSRLEQRIEEYMAHLGM